MDYKSIIAIKNLKKSIPVKTIGTITEIDYLKTKKNDDYIVYKIKDNSGEINCIIFNKNSQEFKVNDKIVIEGRFSYFYENINVSDIKILKNNVDTDKKLMIIDEKDIQYIKNTIYNIKDEFIKKFILIYSNELLEKCVLEEKDIIFLKNSFEYLSSIKNLKQFKNVNSDLIISSLVLSYCGGLFDIEIKNKKIEKINNLIYMNDFNLLDNELLFSTKILNNFNIFLNYFILELEENINKYKNKMLSNIEILNNKILELNKDKDSKQLEYYTNEINDMYLNIEKQNEEKEKIFVKKQMYIQKILKMSLLILKNNDNPDFLLINKSTNFLEYNIIKNILNLKTIYF